ncbi:MAG: hypothetical protein ACI9CF_000304 [Candidatus Omnitrophota bacterium]|jgi:hypothetical protein
MTLMNVLLLNSWENNECRKYIRLITMIFCILQVIGLVGTPATYAGLKPKLSQASAADLRIYYDKSDIVIEGHVVGIKSDTRTASATVIIDSIFKGQYTDESLVVKTNRGKIIINDGEAEFRSHDHAILFLQDLGDGTFICVDGFHGKKNILNDNIYFDNEDSFKTAKIKEYRQEIQRIKENGILTNE